VSTASRTTGSPRARGPRRGRPPGKFTQHRRLDRLRSALEAHPGGLSIAEIATLLHVTARSVRRYLNELKMLTPIEAAPTSPGRENVWRIKASERARSVPIRRAAAYCLVAARGVFDPIRGSALYDALDVTHRAMLQVAGRPARGPAQGEIRGDARLDERLVYVAHPPASYAARAEEIDDLFRAVADLHVLRFRLRAGKEPPGPRLTTHPYALFLHRGTLHLVARDLDRDEVRGFLFDRIADLAVAPDERFKVPADLRAAEFVHGAFGVAVDAPKARVLVEFDARVADEVKARRLHPSQKLATAPDGRVRLSMTVPPSLMPEVQRWVLGYADAARVIEPPELVTAMATALARAAERYS
jgi:predicted DNA-binding transcriptional regulator YafY